MKRHKIITSAALCLMAMSVAVAVEPPADYEDPYFVLSGEADKAIADGDYATAIIRIKDAMAIDPSNPSNVLLLSNLGVMYDALGQDSLSLDAYNKALAIAPSMTTVTGNRARLYLKMGRESDAYEDFSRVILRDSVNAEARYYRGMLALYSGATDVAGDDFRVLASQQPDSHLTRIAMSMYLTRTGDYAGAAEHYEKLVEEEPSEEFFGSLAYCYLQTGNLSEASRVIASGIEKYPDDGALYYFRAWLNRDSYLMKEAKADADMARKLGVSPALVDRLFERR